MFDPNVLLRRPERTQAWDAYPLRHHPFSGEAWENAPQVSPRDPGFRQLAVPEHARVHHDDSEFEVTTYVDMSPVGFEVEQHAPIQAKSSNPTPLNDQPQDFSGDATAAEQSQSEEEPSSENQEAASDFIATDLAEGPLPDSENSEGDDEAQNSDAGDGQSEVRVNAVESQSLSDQSLDSSSTLSDAVWQQKLDQAVELAKQEALQEGMAQGRAAALSENLEQALAEAKVQWANEAQAEQAQAIEAAVKQALAEQSQQWQQQSGERDGRLIELMAGIDQALQQALAQTQVWGDAIKRLAIHIAEQLVLAELSASPAAIQRLIDRCVVELDLPHAGLVTVELAPQDHDLIKAQPDLSWNGMELVINHQLLPGSVKVSCKDTRVSDLILHRLEPMARQLLVAVDDWKQQSAFRPGQSASRPSFQPAKAASPMPSAIAPLSVSSRLIDSIDSGGEHG